MKEVPSSHCDVGNQRPSEGTSPIPSERPIALLSLPNTGTDWFADMLLRQNPRLRYYREFFNPICNPLYENVLNRAFGCEMVDNFAMIAKANGHHESVFQQTWAKEHYNFTKENYSAFKLNWFVMHFDCVVLYRKAELSLPGTRLPVKTWYDAMYCSLLRNRWTLEPDVRVLVDFAANEADTIAKRLVAAFVIYYYKLLKDAHLHNVPILDYERLMDLPVADLASYLRGVPAVADAEKLAYDICEHRRPMHKDFGSLQADEFFVRLTNLAGRCGGAGTPWQPCETSFEAIPEGKSPMIYADSA
jgi:hypothetical protein